jgi:hypothetical protein
MFCVYMSTSHSSILSFSVRFVVEPTVQTFKTMIHIRIKHKHFPSGLIDVIVRLNRV